MYSSALAHTPNPNSKTPGSPPHNGVHQSVSVTNQSSKSLCDDSKTVAIENITSYHKFVRNTKDTKKEFNTHFPGVKIVHAKGTRRGTLLIELSTQAEAKKVIENWKPSYFSQDNGVNNQTTAVLLKDKNCKGMMYNIDHDYEENFIAGEIKKTPGLKKDVVVRRFIKAGKKLSTVMITFGCKEDLDLALHNGLTIGRSPEDVFLYEPVPTVIRCFKCFKFDHTQVWCTKRTKCCQYCSQNHDVGECLIADKPSEYKCVNCTEGNHDSLSKNCPAYKDKLAQAAHHSRS